jgi:antitoxin (DNA-binding transcriptional repressor) of toxin-antitoxin stability system
MLLEVDIEDAPARFAEMIATIDAGLGVLVTRGETVICRLVPEAAFHVEAEDGLSPEEREAREVMAMFESMMNDSF